jgi:hypothetical protein
VPTPGRVDAAAPSLHKYFDDNFQISFFLRFRERYADKDLLTAVMSASAEERHIDDAYVDKEYFFDKFMNRGESAFLDAVFAVESPH